MSLLGSALLRWNPEFYACSPMFEALAPQAPLFSSFQDRWPDLDDYRSILAVHAQPVTNARGLPLKVVAQDAKPMHFEQHYAPRIYLTGEIQTRMENWHDFFQLLTWLVFPKTKAAINRIHYHAAKQRHETSCDAGGRSPMENMLSLFDEGGAIVVATDATLLRLIREFRWKELFWERRDDVRKHLQCVVFGHALYEKALHPYVGMTANCILLEAEASFLASPLPAQVQWIDARAAELFEAGRTLRVPRDLTPLPVLGLPGWADNASASYYDNARYFRPGRRA